MPLDQTLARVRAELAAGQTVPARRRLLGLLATSPSDRGVRDLLSTTYRRTGDAAQAGRWAFLGSSIDPDELAAFTALYPHPDRQLQALRWPVDSRLDDPAAAARLQAVIEHSRALADGRASWLGPHHRAVPRPSVRDRLATAGCSLVGALLGGLTSVGAAVVVRWVVSALRGRPRTAAR